MDISAGLIGKIAAGGTAVAATTTAGVIYGEDIYETFFGEIVDTFEKNSLGLPSFTLPTKNNSPTNITLTVEDLKKVNFDGKSGKELNVTGSGSVTLEIKKIEGNNNDPNSYVFIFKNGDDNAISVGNNGDDSLFTLRKDMNLEFKIKNENNKWSLEKVWNKGHIAEKIGLECNSNDECTLKGGKSIVIKQGSNKSNEISTLDIAGESKIKLQKDAKGYHQGLRFNIEGGDINLTGGGNDVTKLEKNESYQIEKEDGNDKWHLLRKNNSLDGFNEKIRRLGIPDRCKFANSSAASAVCENLSGDDLKKIKFSGSGGINLTSTQEKFKLKIEKDTTNADVFKVENLRFTFIDFPVDVTIPKSVTLKKGTSPEFKIKEKEGNWSLEKAWDIKELTKKIGLTCTSSGKDDKKCTFKSTQKINVFKDSTNYVTEADINNGDKNKKITYEEGAENYNQGFKFIIETPIGISGGTQKSSGSSITQIEKSTYEIKEQNVEGSNKWFFSKVTVINT